MDFIRRIFYSCCFAPLKQLLDEDMDLLLVHRANSGGPLPIFPSREPHKSCYFEVASSKSSDPIQSYHPDDKIMGIPLQQLDFDQ